MSSSVFGATLTHLFAAERVKYDFKYDKCYYNKHYRSNSAGSYCFPLSFSVRSASASIASLSE